MALIPGTRLGTFEIVALIGAGGMGEVYKARDPRLNRMVAIKVLPPSLSENPDLLARFDREAKAVAALSHPNVLGIFDLASQDGLTFAVMELLEGESLRERLKGGALPPKRALEIATELAQGLGAAHERGIVHRDVKPENIFITREGRVKVLDFGLAKQIAEPKRAGADLETEAISLTPNGTEAGVVLGTAGYMSPEQVKGEPADHRSDVFSFGVVLYEMLSGTRPFKGETAHHTMTAILDQDPPALVAVRGPLPPALERLVSHCLEKHPKARFQSMADIAFALQNLSSLDTGARGKLPAGRPQRALVLLPSAALALLVLALAGLGLAGRLHLGSTPAPPTFTRLTHTPGTVETAFFGPDGKTIYFSERIQGGDPELFVQHPGDRDPRPLGVRNALLMGISSQGDLAVLKDLVPYFGTLHRGMLAQVDGGSGAVKEIRENVVMAAWDGSGFAILTDSQSEKITLSFGGRALLVANPANLDLRYLRRSPDGRLLAMTQSDTTSKTELLTYDREGRRAVRYLKTGDAEGDTFTGLAWGPDGNLWFSEQVGDQTVVWSLPANGDRRLLWRGEGCKALMDVAADGRMLLADQQVRRGVLVQRPGELQARDISIASSTQAFGFSADGQSLLLMESPVVDGGTAQDQVYLWRQGGGPPVKIGSGTALSLSPDGKWVNVSPIGFTPEELDPTIASALREAGLDPAAALKPGLPYLLFIPTGAGQPFVLALPKGLEVGTARLTPDGRQVEFMGIDHGVDHLYLMPRAGGAPRPLDLPPSYCALWSGVVPVSPDSARFIVGSETGWAIASLTGGALQPMKGLVEGERPVGWCQDSKHVFIRTTRLPIVVARLDPATGTRQPVFTYRPGDASGLLQVRSIFTPLDGSIFALSYERKLSDLYLVEGLK